MGILISECCVCGTQYGKKRADNVEGTRISHGYCGSACMEAVPTQVMLWDEKLGIYVGDIAYKVNGDLYYHGRLLDDIIVLAPGTHYKDIDTQHKPITMEVVK